jgi:hypothetical protein
MAFSLFHFGHFLPPSETAILIALNLLTVAVTICLGYFAAKIFFYMRLGRLERGWKMVTGGAICLTFAFLSLTFQHFFPRTSSLYFYLDVVGMTVSIAGILLMAIGLRSHYLVWSRKVSRREPNPLLVNQRRNYEE